MNKPQIEPFDDQKAKDFIDEFGMIEFSLHEQILTVWLLHQHGKIGDKIFAFEILSLVAQANALSEPSAPEIPVPIEVGIIIARAWEDFKNPDPPNRASRAESITFRSFGSCMFSSARDEIDDGMFSLSIFGISSRLTA